MSWGALQYKALYATTYRRNVQTKNETRLHSAEGTQRRRNAPGRPSRGGEETNQYGPQRPWTQCHSWPEQHSVRCWGHWKEERMLGASGDGQWRGKGSGGSRSPNGGEYDANYNCNESTIHNMNCDGCWNQHWTKQWNGSCCPQWVNWSRTTAAGDMHGRWPRWR